MLEITGNLAQNVAQLRGAGFDDVINQHPEIELIIKPEIGMLQKELRS